MRISFIFRGIKFVGMFPEGVVGEPWVSDGILYVFCTPKLDGKDIVIKVDGTEEKPMDAFLSGDGFFVIWVDATGLSAGEHKVSVTAEGIPDGEASFTVK